jgi:hypothetical protein
MLAVLLLGLLLPSSAVWPAEDPVQALKVAYLYNFTRFIDWPAESVGEYFDITVVGDPALGRALRVLEQPDKRAQGRSIRVRAIDRAGEVGDSEILFVGAGALSQLPRLRAQTSDRPVLLVGDSPGLARQGVAINFFLKPDILGGGQRLRFEVDPNALSGRGLKVSAQLFDVAEIVR